MTTLTIDVPGKLTAVGLQIQPGGMTYEQWETLGKKLREVNIFSRWWLGDWILYGERHLSEKYSQAIDATNYDRETLRGFAYVAERFSMERRRAATTGVTFSHHRVVAKMDAPEADGWLDKVAAEGWTVSELKREIRRSKAEDSNEPDPTSWVDIVTSPRAVKIGAEHGDGVIVATFGKDEDGYKFLVLTGAEPIAPGHAAELLAPKYARTAGAEFREPPEPEDDEEPIDDE